jgi:putative ABC transport system permease protein
LNLIGLDLLDAADSKGARIESIEDGDLLARLLAPDAVFIGKRLASDWGVRSGDALVIVMGAERRRLTIRGIVTAEGGVPSVWDQTAVMDIAAAQSVFNAVGRIDRIDLITEPGRVPEEVARGVAAVVPPSVTVGRPSRRNQQVERMVQAFQLNLTTLSGVGLLVGLLLVYNTIGFAVVRQRAQIGILSAMGLGRNAITALFMGEAAVIGIVGGIVGTALGVVLATSLVALLGRTISELYVPMLSTSASSGWRSLLGSIVETPPAAWWQGGMVGALVSAVGALSPSLDASRTAPARALSPGEYESAQGLRSSRLAVTGILVILLAGLLALPGPIGGLPLFGYGSALCLLVGLSCLAPALIRGFDVMTRGLSPLKAGASGRGVGALGRLAADQIARAPGRNAVTISAMMVGIAIMVGVGSMIGSFRETVQMWIDQTILADFVVAPVPWLQGDESGVLTGRLPAAWADDLATLPGVDAVDTYRELPVEIDGRPAALIARNLRLHAERSRYLFLQGESREVLERAARENGVLISEVLARKFGLQAGGGVRLMTPAGEEVFPVQGVFYDYATDGGKLVMDRSLYRRLWSDETTTVLAVYLKPSVDRQAARRRIDGRLQQLAGEDRPVVVSNGEVRKEILAIFDRTFRVTYALEAIAVIIAMLGIVNTLLTSVLERRREIATLRALGASERQIAGLVLWESLYLGVLGGMLGVVGGLLLSVLLVEVINKQSFGWTIHWAIQWGLLAQAIGLASAAAVLAGYLPARWAARQPPVEGLRYE